MLSMIASVTTIAVLVTFIVIVFWAWSGKRKADFDEAANLVFDEPQASSMTTKTGEK